MVTRKFLASDIERLVDEFKPFSIGFDKVFDNIATVGDLANNYPPYNIIELGEEKFLIEIACAGFREDEFNISLVPNGNKLVVQGVQDRGEDTSKYYHQGIAARNFTRTFALSDDVHVEAADFVDGMLKIYLERIIPEEKKVRTIPVKSKKQLLID